MRVLTLSIICVFLYGVAFSHSILDFGAVPDDYDTTTAFANSKALERTFEAANKSSHDRVVRIPPGLTFFIGPTLVTGIRDLNFRIEGTLRINNDVDAWPAMNGKKLMNAI